jgi:hypothetical protein
VPQKNASSQMPNNISTPTKNHNLTADERRRQLLLLNELILRKLRADAPAEEEEED